MTLRRPWLVVLIAATLYLGFVMWRGGGPMALVLTGTQFSEGDPLGTEGYDGQFVYTIARDPAHAAPLIDAPAYRYQRILLPMLARGLALGNPALIAWTLPVINLAALVVGTALVEAMLVDRGVSRWYALTVGLYAGQLAAARVDLPEPLALALVLAAMLAFHRRKMGWSAGFFALAALSKETSLLFVAGYAAWLWFFDTKRRAVGFAALAGGPFALFQLFLWRWLGSFGVGAGGANATPFEIIPFAGWLRIAGASWAVFALFSLVIVPLAIIPALWSLWATLTDIVRRRAHPWVFALLVNAAIIPFVPFSTFREPFAMLRFTVSLVACVVLYGGLRRSKRVLFYSSLWLASLILLVKDPFI